jgi:uncharacterized protein (DUF2147 family)
MTERDRPKPFGLRLLSRLCAAVWLAAHPLPSAAQGANDLVGLWQTGARDGSWGYVRIAPCGGLYCGTLEGGGGARVDPGYFGTRMIVGMAWDGSGFSGGRLLDVERNQWYAARIRFRGPDRIRVSGCVLAGILCGGQTWHRIP